jgi:uncharacterized membrane protein
MSVATNSIGGPDGGRRSFGSSVAGRTGTTRVVGVDVARGLALVGMFAVHIFWSLHDDYTPSLTHQVMAGHALATFVLLAGVSLTFVTKRRSGGSWLSDRSTAAALATRALIVTFIGLLLNSWLDPDIWVILPYYGLMFLLAIPLLRLSSRALIMMSIALVLLAPLLVLATFDTDLPREGPTLGTLAHPLDLIITLLVTGYYPVVAWMAFICLGIVIGRLDLSSTWVAVRLTVTGGVLAAGAWLLSTLLLLRLGGLEHLRAAAPPDVSPQAARNIIMWEPEEKVSSWWWLVERAVDTTTPFRLVHDIGIAMAWLGVCLLITHVRPIRRALGPVAAAGAMSLSLYTAHVVVLGQFSFHHPIELFVVMVYVALTFAALWRRNGRRGPLEALVAWASSRARKLAGARSDTSCEVKRELSQVD